MFIFSNLSEEKSIHPRDAFDLPYIGLQCQISETPWKILEFWKMLIQALSHPLWFPMLCLAFTPILAFLLIGWEVTGQNVNDRFTNTKPIGILLSIYVLVFFYDLLQFATKTDSTKFLFTHTNSVQFLDSSGNSVKQLLIIYVFHHWSRPLAACVRNLMCLCTNRRMNCQKMILKA